MLLTDLKIKAAKPKEKSFKLADGAGLYLEITPSGGKHWKLKYRFDRKEKKLALGSYPLFSLAEARLRRDEARRMLADGRDPGQAKKDAVRQRRADALNTFQLVALEWQKFNSDRWSANHAATVKRRMEVDVFPVIGAMPIKELKTIDLVEMVRKIEGRGAHEMARRALQYCSQIFRYAIVHALADANPAATIKPGDILRSVQKGHFAALDYRDLPQFLLALDRNDARMFPQTRLAVEFLMHTFVRTGEMIKAKWSEIDWEGKQWIIPGSRMKMRRDHIVPLSTSTISRNGFLRGRRLYLHRQLEKGASEWNNLLVGRRTVAAS